MGGILSLPVLGVAVIYGITGIPNFAIGVIGVFGGFLSWYFLSFNIAKICCKIIRREWKKK